MSFDSLEKTPGVAPLLVRLYDTHNLYSLAGEKESSGSCTELTTIMVDLLKIELSEREKELVTDVILGLMKQAERDLRAALSERLSAMDNIPLRMVLGLANDEADVADPVLRLSPVLQDLDLAYILQSKGVSHGRSIAKRKVLSGDIINMLADTKDFEIAVNLCENNGIKLTQHAFDIYADMIKEHHGLASPLARRGDLPRDVANKIYEFVAEDLKEKLRATYGDHAKIAEDQIDDIVLEVTKPHTGAEAATHLIRVAQSMYARGELKPSVMISNLRRGQNATFLAQFSVYFKLPADQAKKVICEKSGRALAMACRSMEASKADFVSLYLLTEKLRFHERKVIDHKELSQIMMMFDEIHISDARAAMQKLRH